MIDGVCGYGATPVQTAARCADPAHILVLSTLSLLCTGAKPSPNTHKQGNKDASVSELPGTTHPGAAAWAPEACRQPEAPKWPPQLPPPPRAQQVSRCRGGGPAAASGRPVAGERGLGGGETCWVRGGQEQHATEDKADQANGGRGKQRTFETRILFARSTFVCLWQCACLSGASNC